jgi:hypothetical protein
MSRRSPDPIDTTPFESIMAEALWAFGTQLDFGTSMAAKARVILAKRATHAARSALKIAEADARAACVAAGAFTCASRLPCSVGPSCRFSAGELRDLEVPDEPLSAMRGGKLVERVQARAGRHPRHVQHGAGGLPLPRPAGRPGPARVGPLQASATGRRGMASLRAPRPLRPVSEEPAASRYGSRPARDGRVHGAPHRPRGHSTWRKPQRFALVQEPIAVSAA